MFDLNDSDLLFWLNIQKNNAEIRISNYTLRSQTEEHRLKTKSEALYFMKKMIMTDKENKEYKFITNDLQYATVGDLKMLLEMIERGFKEPKSVGRPQGTKKIFVYDKDNNLIATYNNREECMKGTGISKQFLYQLLKGTKKYKKCTYKEEE